MASQYLDKRNTGSSNSRMFTKMVDVPEAASRARVCLPKSLSQHSWHLTWPTIRVNDASTRCAISTAH
jgi:hypothetical protein